MAVDLVAICPAPADAAAETLTDSVAHPTKGNKNTTESDVEIIRRAHLCLAFSIRPVCMIGVMSILFIFNFRFDLWPVESGAKGKESDGEKDVRERARICCCFPLASCAASQPSELQQIQNKFGRQK